MTRTSSPPSPLRDDGDRPLAGPDQPGGQRAHNPVPGVLGGANDHRVGPALLGRAVELGPRIPHDGEELEVKPDLRCCVPQPLLDLVRRLRRRLAHRGCHAGGGADVRGQPRHVDGQQPAVLPAR